ncbi:hypothetical protein [Longimicrobium sp.]|uniref:hypothetical protein n=1 Tax=Longimicrobium sp. TaxID=2029185 RepID=UPI003B3AF4FA
MRRTFLFFAAAFALLACDGGSPTGGADAAMDRDEALTAARAWDAVGVGVMEGIDGPSIDGSQDGEPRQVTATAALNRTRACPVSGTATLRGTRVLAHNPVTDTRSMHLAATRTDAACTVNARRGGGTIRITTTPDVAVTAHQTWTAGQPGTRTVTHKGSFGWRRSTGQSGTCAVDLTATFTPVTRTYTLGGAFCGHAVSVTRTAP